MDNEEIARRFNRMGSLMEGANVQVSAVPALKALVYEPFGQAV